LTGALPLVSALERYRHGLAHNPWLTRYPLFLADVAAHTLEQPKGKVAWFLGSEPAALLPLSRRAKNQWLLLSITGGAPAHCFGEWLEDGFLPLGLWSAERYWPL
jgi:hypothetical protein